MAESMKDYETELEASLRKLKKEIFLQDCDQVDEKEVVIDLKYYAEGNHSGKDYSKTGIFH